MVGFLFILLLAAPAQAQELRLLEADYVGLEGSKVKTLRDPYIPEHTTGDNNGEEWDYGAAMMIDLCLLCIGDWKAFWNNRVHTHGTDSQVRHVGWYWELGVDLYPDRVRIFHRHHSQHCMECEGTPTREYPLLDEYVVQFDMFRRK